MSGDYSAPSESVGDQRPPEIPQTPAQALERVLGLLEIYRRWRLNLNDAQLCEYDGLIERVKGMRDEVL